ncbi:MAG: lipopolysaccharide biosynthesis protein, partial [Lactococcus lactis]
MNNKAKNLFRNLRYTISANLSILIISVVLNLFVPRILGIKEYSYWQLYVFYSSYVGFLHFGWLDGIYLKIGGEEYDNLDKVSLNVQFWYLFVSQIFIAFGIVLYVLLRHDSGEKSLILLCTAVVTIITNLRMFILYIFQSTNRIKEYANLSRFDRYIYIVFIFIYLFLGGRSFVVLAVSDIFSRLIVTLWGIYQINDIVFNKVKRGKKYFSEILENIKIGSNLMISNIASMLIIGITRLLVENKWDIETFGKLSFTLSISNMFMTFINAVGIVIFPLLRRTNRSNLKILYEQIRTVFVPLTFSLLLFFNPIRIILENWLPAYKDSLRFMGVLFPMVIYEGRMSLLINTYLKTIRKEKYILLANMASLLLTIV